MTTRYADPPHTVYDGPSAHEEPHTRLVDVDALAELAGYVRHHFGDHGYRIGIEATNGAAVVAVVACADGGRFRLYVPGRYYPAVRLPDRRELADALIAYRAWNAARPDHPDNERSNECP